MSQEQNPALSEERQAYRNRFAVRLITVQEEGRNIANQQEGVYGFTSSPNSVELPLFVDPVHRSFEIHKLTGGEIAYVGYLSEKEYESFQAGAEPGVIHLYPEPHKEAQKLVSVPMSRVDRVKPPTRDDGNSMRMDVAPKPEFL